VQYSSDLIVGCSTISSGHAMTTGLFIGQTSGILYAACFGASPSMSGSSHSCP
jgi:hypothetical protein